MSDFWTKDRPLPRWATPLAGAGYTIFGLVGVTAILLDSAGGEYARAAEVMQLGSLGGTALSAMAVATASWIVILGLRMIARRRLDHLSLATPIWLGSVLANPTGLAHKSCSDARSTVLIYLVMAIVLTGVSRLLSTSKALIPETKQQTGQP